MRVGAAVPPPVGALVTTVGWAVAPVGAAVANVGVFVTSGPVVGWAVAVVGADVFGAIEGACVTGGATVGERLGIMETEGCGVPLSLGMPPNGGKTP